MHMILKHIDNIMWIIPQINGHCIPVCSCFAISYNLIWCFEVLRNSTKFIFQVNLTVLKCCCFPGHSGQNPTMVAAHMDERLCLNGMHTSLLCSALLCLYYYANNEY